MSLGVRQGDARRLSGMVETPSPGEIEYGEDGHPSMLEARARIEVTNKMVWEWD